MCMRAVLELLLGAAALIQVVSVIPLLLVGVGPLMTLATGACAKLGCFHCCYGQQPPHRLFPVLHLLLVSMASL